MNTPHEHPTPTPKNDQPVRLSDLPAGKMGVVCRLEGDKEFMNRVASLGFTPGAQVSVLNNPSRGPMIVSMYNAHLALGRQEADLIQVDPL
jgi:Fe2+ transport system protein FeoA